MAEINKVTIEEITGLYETFLGKFHFFRKFITIFLNREIYLNKLEERVYTAESKISEMEKTIENLNVLIEALPKGNKETNQRNLSASSPHEILQRQYDLYNKENNTAE